MARFAYFIDLPNGETLEWADQWARDARGRAFVKAAAGISHDGKGFTAYIQGQGRVRVTRTVELKANPSRHVCDDRCMFATGKMMRCECSCGGKNHGKGERLVCEAA